MDKELNVLKQNQTKVVGYRKKINVGANQSANMAPTTCTSVESSDFICNVGKNVMLAQSLLDIYISFAS